MTYLEDGGSVRRAPRVQQVVLARGDEPFATAGELERKYTALVQMQLVLVRLAHVQHLHVRAFHPMATTKAISLGLLAEHQATYPTASHSPVGQ